MSQTWIVVAIGLLAGFLAGMILDQGSRWYLERNASGGSSQSRILWVSGIKLAVICLLFFLFYRWVPLLLGTGAGILIEKQWHIFKMIRSLKNSKGREEK